MRDFICDKIKQIKPSGIRRLFDIANEIPDVISLGVGEPDFDTPWHIREEGIYSLQKGRTFYTSNSGLPELREEIANYMLRKYGLVYDPKHEIILTVGGSEAIDIAFRATLNPGDEVVYPEPGYVSYEPCIRLADGVPVPIELSAETEFRLQPEQLEAAITPKTKALLISYPNNPTGAARPRDSKARPARNLGRNLQRALLQGAPRQHCVAARNARAHGRHQRLLEILRDDGLASRLGLRARADNGVYAEDTPVRHNVRADHESVRGYIRAAQRGQGH